MSALNDHIRLINTKLQHLLKQHESLRAENHRQKQTIELLQKQQEELKTKLTEIQQQNLILKASNRPLNEADKKELDQKINSYIRNIDKCISLLAQ